MTDVVSFDVNLPYVLDQPDITQSYKNKLTFSLSNNIHLTTD